MHTQVCNISVLSTYLIGRKLCDQKYYIVKVTVSPYEESRGGYIYILLSLVFAMNSFIVSPRVSANGLASPYLIFFTTLGTYQVADHS